MHTPRSAPIDVPMAAQPDDFTCGPTSLQAVYAHFGEHRELDEILPDIPFLAEGGTLAVHLGMDALRRGYHARLHSYNLQVFDPTWLGWPMDAIDRALAGRAASRSDPRLRESIAAYREFIAAGGVVDLGDLTPKLLHDYFDRGIPVLAGLSATFLYGGARERVDGRRMVDDDIAGDPQGHFVVLCGFDGDQVIVADPFEANPAGEHHYAVEVSRLIQAILLGVLTYDGNLLVVSREQLP